MRVCTQSCPISATQWTVAHHALVSTGFSRQEYWSGLPFPPPGDLPDPGIQRVFPVSPTLVADSLPRSHLGFPGGSAGKESHLECGIPGFNPWIGKIPWRRERLPTPVFWPGEFHRLCSSWGCKESDMTERLSPAPPASGKLCLYPLAFLDYWFIQHPLRDTLGEGEKKDGGRESSLYMPLLTSFRVSLYLLYICSAWGFN